MSEQRTLQALLARERALEHELTHVRNIISDYADRMAAMSLENLRLRRQLERAEADIAYQARLMRAQRP